MGVAGVGSALSSLGSQYDFTKLTNKQLYDAANQLGSEGKISQEDAAQLLGIAQGIDSVPISGQNKTTQQILADPTQHNFIKEIQGDDYDANLPGSIGGAPLNALLKDIETYQAKEVDQPNQTISI